MGLILLLHQLRLATVIAFYATLVFPGVVAPIWPWWKEWFGWNVITFDWSFTIVSFPTWLNLTFDVSVRNSVPWAWFELVGIWLVILNIPVRVAIIFFIQKSVARKNHEENGNATPRHQRVSAKRRPPRDQEG